MVIHLIRHLKPDASSGQLNLEVACVFTSPLARAHRTARLFFPQHEIQLVPELAEISMGEWEGRAWEEIEVAWPELARQKLNDWFAVTPPGGEAWRDFEARVTAAWARIRRAIALRGGGARGHKFRARQVGHRPRTFPTASTWRGDYS